VSFLDEFKRRCRKINAGEYKRHPEVYEDLIKYKITRYRSDGSVTDIMWHLTHKEAITLCAWRFKSHVKFEDGEEVLIWYKIREMENSINA
jgi:hypothetical protein